IADVAVKLLAQQKRVPEAIDIAARYAALEPEDPWLWERLGAAAHARDIDAAIMAYASAADKGSASAARRLIEIGKEHGRWEHYVDAEQQRLTAVASRDEDEDEDDADEDSDFDAAPDAPERRDDDAPVESEPPASEPRVPCGLVLRPRFLTAFGPFE